MDKLQVLNPSGFTISYLQIYLLLSQIVVQVKKNVFKQPDDWPHHRI